MGMQWESATLPDAVCLYFKCCHLRMSLGLTHDCVSELPGKTEQHKDESEDLPLDLSDGSTSAGLRTRRDKLDLLFQKKERV